MNSLAHSVHPSSELVKDYIDSFFSDDDQSISGDSSLLDRNNVNSLINYDPPVDNHSMVMECSVAGRRFCVDLSRLIAVVIAEKHGIVPGSTYSLGEVNHSGKCYKVIDLGVKVRQPLADYEGSTRYIVLCDNGKALFCDKIIDNRPIDYKFVSWRKRRLSTPWNAGIDSAYTTMVIDIDQLALLVK